MSKTSAARDYVLVGLASIALSLAIVTLSTPIWFSDSHTYTNYAFYLTIGAFDPTLYWRTVGYPLLLILTGTVAFSSITGIVLLQGACAAAIPSLSYMSLAPVSTTAARIAAAVSLLSLAPFSFINVIYPDQVYMTFLVLITALLVRISYGRGSWPASFLIVLATGVLTTLRPVGIILGLVALFAVLRRGKFLVVTISTAAVIAAATVVHADYITSRVGETPSMSGRQIFLNPYLDGDGTYDPALEQLVADALREAVEEKSIDMQTAGPPMDDDTYAAYYHALGGDYRELARAMLSEPNMMYYWSLFVLTDVANSELDRTLMNSAINEVLTNPLPLAVGAIKRYVALVMGTPWRYTYQGIWWEITPFWPAQTLGSDFRPEASAVTFSPEQYEDSPPHPVLQALDTYFLTIYRPSAAISYLLMLCGLVGTAVTRDRSFKAIGLIFLVHSFNIAGYVLLTDPQYRYQLQSVPLSLIGGSAALHWILTRVCAYWQGHRRAAGA